MNMEYDKWKARIPREDFFLWLRPNGRRWLFPFVAGQVKRFLDSRGYGVIFIISNKS